MYGTTSTDDGDETTASWTAGMELIVTGKLVGGEWTEASKRGYQLHYPADASDMKHVKNHHNKSHEDISPTSSVPVGPYIDWTAPVAGH